jgi:choice-of-anchor B domain-containing protein
MKVEFEMKQVLRILSRACLFFVGFVFATWSAAQSPCIDGFADGYPCDRIDLLSQMSNETLMGTGSNDIWGWEDPITHVEYALVGEREGLSIVDLSDPVNPFLAAFMATHTTSSTWRDMKVHADHVYVVSEANGHGLQVLDLNQLRDLTEFPALLPPTKHVDDFSDAHNVVINEEAALLFAVGTNLASGGLVAFDISEPDDPVLVGDYGEAGYTHDAQAVIYNGPDEEYQGQSLVFAANANKLAILNATDPSDIFSISIANYDYSYTHQCWLTEDHRYLILGDETDEQNQGINTRTLIWDVQNLEEPILIGEHFSEGTAIDHNQYVVGNLLFQANYSAGLRMLSLTDVADGELTEVGFFDVYPEDDAPVFTNGSWSTYPYFESGVVVVTSRQDGIFVVRPKYMEAVAVASEVCFDQPMAIQLTVLDGLLPPYELTIMGLPEGLEVNGFQNNMDAPGSFAFTISGLENAEANVEFSVALNSALNEVSVPIQFQVNLGQVWSEDADGDGYGSLENSIQACEGPLGYVSNQSDCNDENSLVYEGAAGTGEGIDNNCNGLIDSSEQGGCVGDFNGDQTISVADLLILLGDFGCTSNCLADLNGDGVVNVGDLLGFLGVFGEECP